MVFGLINRRALQEALDRQYNQLASYVVDSILKPLTDKLNDRLNGEGGIESRLRALESQTTNDTLADLMQRVKTLEDAQQNSGILSGVVVPRGEVTFEDVAGLAREVTDKAYERIRDYFLLEMARKGYQNEKPNFMIFDDNSRILLRFQVTIDEGWGNGEKIGLYIENFPDFVEKFYNQPRGKSLITSREVMHKRGLVLTVDPNNMDDWERSLQEDLPDMLKAYMIGYSLRCLDKKNYDAALKVQDRHGLKENPALLSRMHEVMQQDPALASQFVAHYQ